MRLWLKVLGLMLCLGVAAPQAAPTKEKAPKKEKKEKKKSKQENKKADPYNVPIPVGHEAKGIKIPYYDSAGKLQMIFQIETAKRAEQGRLEMSKVFVETYNDEGKVDLGIDLPTSVLDLKTRIVTSNTAATVRRADFEITGDKLEFNTETRRGQFTGNIRMLIYNLGEESADQKSK